MTEYNYGPQLNNIQRQLNDLKGDTGALHGAVQQVSTAQDLTRSDLAELREAFAAFLRRDEFSKSLQLAQTQLIEVRQQLETEFGHHAQVRRGAVGVLQAMDTGVVTQAAVAELSEELMISTPRYWLAPALVALGAWLRDDRALAERALREALRRDHDKSALFFALVLRRQCRDQATARWLQQYVARQDPAALSREFTVVVDATATGALGVSARPLIMKTMREWHERLSARSDIVEAQVERWQRLLAGLASSQPTHYTLLPTVSPTWPALSAAQAQASVFAAASSFFDGVLGGEIRADPDLATKVDAILDHLTGDYDQAEAPLRRREAQLEAIVAHEGDKEAARQASDDEASALADEVDFLTLITNAAFFPERSGASRGTQRMAVALSRDWAAEAVGRHEAQSLAARPPSVELVVDDWKGTIDARSTEATLTGSIRHHMDGRTAAEVAAVKLSGGAIAGAVGAGFALFLAIVILSSGGGGAGGFFMSVALGLGAWVGYQASQLPTRREAAQTEGDQRRNAAVAKVQGAIAEAVDWNHGFHTHLARATPLRQRLAALAPSAHLAASPDHARGVLV